MAEMAITCRSPIINSPQANVTPSISMQLQHIQRLLINTLELVSELNHYHEVLHFFSSISGAESAHAGYIIKMGANTCTKIPERK